MTLRDKGQGIRDKDRSKGQTEEGNRDRGWVIVLQDTGLPLETEETDVAYRWQFIRGTPLG